MAKIVRKPDRASGGVTPEELVQMKAVTDEWIRIAYRTQQADPVEVERCIKALYAAADLAEPKVLLVPSPIVMVAVYGAASALYEAKKTIDVRTIADTIIKAVKDSDLPVARAAMKACRKLAGQKGVNHAKEWVNAYQGGNMWVTYESFIASGRDVLGLRLPEHKKYQTWEDAAKSGGFRVLHPEFCVVSDFPEFVKIDENNQPHCPDGPSHRWRDGWSLYYWRGTRIPDEWLTKGYLTADMVLKQQNMERRRAGTEILGWDHILTQLDAKVINDDGDPLIGTLLEANLDINGEITPTRFLRATCGTGRQFALVVPNEMSTALEAQAWMQNLDPSEFLIPEVRT